MVSSNGNEFDHRHILRCIFIDQIRKGFALRKSLQTNQMFSKCSSGTNIVKWYFSFVKWEALFWKQS